MDRDWSISKSFIRRLIIIIILSFDIYIYIFLETGADVTCGGIVIFYDRRGRERETIIATESR